MSTSETALTPVYRHPLALPAGSIRALLIVMILGLFWLILLLPGTHEVRVPLFLYCLLTMVPVFIVAHGRSIGPENQPGPWWLPRGFFRGLIVVGFLLVIGWQFFANRELLLRRLVPNEQELRHWPYLLLGLGVGFALGRLAQFVPWRRAAWHQDFLAWVSNLAMLGLIAEVVIRVFITPNVERELDLTFWESMLTGIVAFYFGARS